MRQEPAPAERPPGWDGDTQAETQAPTAPPAATAAGPAEDTDGCACGCLIVIGIVGAMGWAEWKNRRDRKRREAPDLPQSGPPRCKDCGGDLKLLGEAVEDAYLDEEQIAEEAAGTWQHDVYQCSHCGRIAVRSHGFKGSEAQPCPRCDTRALETDWRLVDEPSGDRPGRGRVTVTCRNCGHTDRRFIAVPHEPTAAPEA